MRWLVVVSFALAMAGCPSAPATRAGAGPEPAPSSDAAPGTGVGERSAAEEGAAAVEQGDGSGEVPAGDGSGSAAPLAPPDPLAALRAEAAGQGPISDALRARIWSVPEDDVPEVLDATREDLENRHYLTCDELNLHLWYEHVRDIGGAYAGVGSDQAYTFIGWMRPSIAWLTDYDPWVRATHKIYRVAFEGAEDLAGFRAFWDGDNEDASWTAIEARWADDADLDTMRQVWGLWRGRINRRLREYGRVLRDAGVPSFLTDEETYDFVRGFVMADRARPLLANLLDDTALRAIGDVSREIDVPVRVFYLSNAEEYWDYPEEFRANFESLHFDERSLILRTDSAKQSNGDYRYGVQPALNFREWLRQDYVEDVGDVWEPPYVRDETHVPIGVLDEPPFDR